MRVGVLIPDRNDRPRFLENCLRMIKAQTVQPEIVEIVKDPAPEFLEITNRFGKPQTVHNKCDITMRYRLGYDRLRNKGLDVILFIENDDWYSPYYIETMIREWKEAGKPQIFGTSYTTYYHIKVFGYFNMYHDKRSSMMSTLIKPDMNINWCNDNIAYTDMHVWKKCGLKGATFTPKKYIALGIKHGDGLTGGKSHIDGLVKYINKDPEKKFLKNLMIEDPESFNFYTNYFNI